MQEALLENSNFSILGDEDLIVGFKALGFKTYPTGQENLENLLKNIINSKTAICLVEEKIWLEVFNKLKSYKIDLFPIFLPFSLTKSKDNKVLDSIIKDIKLKATGKV